MSNTLRISEACSLALHAMVLIAGDVDKIFSTKEIAAELHGSEFHLSKVLQRLARAGLVRAERGPHGGFQLARDPQKITLMEVYEVIEGPFPVNQCLLSEPVCQGEKCILGSLLSKVNRLVQSHLQEHTLAQMTRVFRKERV